MIASQDRPGELLSYDSPDILDIETLYLWANKVIGSLFLFFVFFFLSKRSKTSNNSPNEALFHVFFFLPGEGLSPFIWIIFILLLFY